MEEQAPILLHGTIGAGILSRDYGIDDPDVLAATRYHTTARAAMSTLEKVVFLADKIEPGKVRAEPALAKVRQLADRDLDAAILEYLNQHLLEANRRGWPLHPHTVAARNELLMAGPTRPRASVVRPLGPSWALGQAGGIEDRSSGGSALSLTCGQGRRPRQPSAGPRRRRWHIAQWEGCPLLERG